MQVKVLPISRWKGTEQSLVVFMAEGQPRPMGWAGNEASLKKVLVQAREEGFSGRINHVLILHPDGGDPARRILMVGVGGPNDLGPAVYRVASGQAARIALRHRLRSLTFQFPERGEPARIREHARAIVEGAGLGQYRFGAYKSATPDDPKTALEHLIILHGDEVHANDVEAGVQTGETVAGAVTLARDLANEPANSLSPGRLVERARKLGTKVRVRLMEAKTLERMGMGGIIGVGRGSHNPPVLIHLHYQGSKPKSRIALVGKGVCFDSGGLSLKPADAMETMKSDMAGAAAVMAVMQGAEKMKLPLTLEGYIPAVENMPGGGATKPGDVLKMFNGKTVEVLNTDAEGRVILADALAYAVREKPDHVVDIATLTGACITALGTKVTGVMGTDAELVKALAAAGTAAGEPMWELPLVTDYREMLKSRVADLKNIGGKREAGAIMGGLFLQEFVGTTSWVHLDIAGTAWADKDLPLGPAGATGAPVRAMLTWLMKLAASPANREG